MKIGPVDIRIAALVYAAAILILGIVVLRMYLGNSGVRLEGYYRSTILAGMNSESNAAQQEGIDACRTVLNVSPQNASVRLYLSTLLLHQKKLVEAEKEFKEAADLPNATPDEKAYALIGAGVSHFRALSDDAPAKYAAAAAECEKLYFQPAADAQKTNGDALVNAAFCKALQNPASAGAQIKTCDAVLAGSPLPSLSGMQQLYSLKGLALLQEGKAFEALSEFEKAQAMQPAGLPGLPSPQENRRMALLGGMVQKDISESQRNALMQTIEKEMSSYGKHEVDVLIALGLARSMQKNDAEWVKKYFPAAKANFNTAINRDPKDSRAYLNLASLYEERISELANTLSTQVPGLNGDPPPPNPWVEAGKAEINQADHQTLGEITGLLHEQDALWELFFSKADVGPSERVNAKLRHLACVRRMAFMTNDANKSGLWTRALAIADEMVKTEPNNPLPHFTLAEVLLEQGQNGQQVKAVNELTLAKSCGMNSPLLDRLLAELGNHAELTDVRPSKSGPSFGAVPLVRATLSGVNSEAVKGFAMTLDGRQVQAARIGSQVMFQPKVDDLKDGNHTIGVTINSGAGAPVKLPEFEFKVSKKPPTWTITADGTGVQPVFTIKLADEAGIDFTSLQLVLKNSAGGFTRKLVVNGKTNCAMAGAGLKANEAIAKNEFKITPGTDLQPGSYIISIDVSDNAGNVLRTVSTTFEVK